jgi:chaperonin GroES
VATNKKGAKKGSVKKKTKPTAKKAKKPAPKMIAKSATKAKPAKLFAVPSKIDWHKFIQPLQDRVVAIEIEAPNTTESGLYLPVENESFLKARVVAAGLGRVSKKGKVRPLDVRVGDVIIMTTHAGTKVTVENQDAIIVREDDVLGIVSTPSPRC